MQQRGGGVDRGGRGGGAGRGGGGGRAPASKRVLAPRRQVAKPGRVSGSRHRVPPSNRAPQVYKPAAAAAKVQKTFVAASSNSSRWQRQQQQPAEEERPPLIKLGALWETRKEGTLSGKITLGVESFNVMCLSPNIQKRNPRAGQMPVLNLLIPAPELQRLFAAIQEDVQGTNLLDDYQQQGMNQWFEMSGQETLDQRQTNGDIAAAAEDDYEAWMDEETQHDDDGVDGEETTEAEPVATETAV